MNVRPLIYGYLRADLVKHSGQLEVWDQQIREFARAKGFEVGTVFQEPPNLMWSEFAALMIELKRSECHHVAIPALAHMLRPGSTSPNALVDLLHAEANARVWIADPNATNAGMNVTDPFMSGNRG